MPAHDPRKRRKQRKAAPPADLNTLLEQLRTLLHASPSRAGWHRLGELLDRWADPRTLPLGLDYAEAHLDPWPDDLRANRGRAFPWLLQTLDGASQPRTRLLRHATLHKRYSPPLQRPVAWGDLAGLRTLHIEHLPGAHHLLASLAAAQRPLPHLHTLAVTHSKLLPEHLGALATTPNLPALQRLNLSGNPLHAAALRPLLDAPNLPALTHLEVAHSALDSLRPLLGAARLTQLELLDLSHPAGFPLQAAQALTPTAFPSLRALRLGACNLTPDHLRIPRLGDLLAQLHDLSLDHNNLGAAGLRALLDAHPDLQPRHLDLTACRLNDAALDLLGSADALGSLQTLRLGRNHFSARALVRFLRAAHLPHLTRLELDGTDANDDVATAILDAPFAPRLAHLAIHDTRLSGLGVRALLTSPRVGCDLQRQLAANLFAPPRDTALYDDLLIPTLLAADFPEPVERDLLTLLPTDFWATAPRHPEGWRLAAHPRLPEDARALLLHRMTVLQLRQVAADLGLHEHARLDRAALVPVIEAHLLRNG